MVSSEDIKIILWQSNVIVHIVAFIPHVCVLFFAHCRIYSLSEFVWNISYLAFNKQQSNNQSINLILVSCRGREMGHCQLALIDILVRKDMDVNLHYTWTHTKVK